MNDEQLKNFLQKNQPLPPALNPTESDEQLQVLLQQIGSGKKTRPSRPLWISIAATGFASLFIYFAAQNLNKNDQNLTPTVQTEVTTTSFEEEEVFVEADLPTLGIGENYLILAGSQQIK